MRLPPRLPGGCACLAERQARRQAGTRARCRRSAGPNSRRERLASVHDQILRLACAARRTAPMMRLWVPQRQRLGAQGWRDVGFVGAHAGQAIPFGGHDHAVDAIAALRRLLVDEGLLQRMRLVDVPSPSMVTISCSPTSDRVHAGSSAPRRPARAGAASLEPQPKLARVERKVVAQDIKQGRVGLGRNRVNDPLTSGDRHGSPRCRAAVAVIG